MARMLLKDLYPNFAMFDDNGMEIRRISNYPACYKFVSAELGTQTPSFMERIHGCYVELKEDNTEEPMIQEVSVKSVNDGMVNIYMWKTPWAIRRRSTDPWTVVLDFNRPHLFGGDNHYKLKGDTADAYLSRRIDSSSFNYKIERMIRAKNAVAIPIPEMKTIPIFVAELIRKDAISNKGSCPISMAPFGECESITVTSCYHIFDTSSIQKWYRYKKTCPLCMTKIDAMLEL